MCTFIDERAPGTDLPDGFVDLPHRLYAGDPQWIPEDPAALEAAFDPSNPWFVNGDARTFCVAGEVRAAAFLPRGLTIDGAPAAFFGYWQSAGDSAAERALMQRVQAWASAGGAAALYGPVDFSTFSSNRFRLHAEAGATTFVGEPYNLPSYPPAMEALGLSRRTEYVTQVLTMSSFLEVGQIIAPGAARATDLGYRVETLDHDRWVDSIDDLYPLVDSIFADNFAYTPISKQAFARAFGGQYIRRACPHGSVITIGPGGDIVGFFLAYPDYGPLVVQGAGPRRVAVADLEYEQHAWQVAGGAAVLKTVGVSPDHRRAGVMELMVAEMGRRLSPRYSGIIGALIRADNPSRLLGQKIQMQERRYALYGRTDLARKDT